MINFFNKQLHLSMLCAVLMVLSYYAGVAQDFRLAGSVNEMGSNKEIPFVNISLHGKPVSTVSDKFGFFQLNVKEENLDDSITFSAPGYQPLKLKIAIIKQYNRSHFGLIPRVNNESDEYSVKSFKKSRIVGVNNHLPIFNTKIVPGYGHDIIEIGTNFKLGKQIHQVLAFSVFLQSNAVDSAYFRLHFYESDKGNPGKKIATKDILVKLPVQTGWTSIDLKEQKIYLKGAIFVGLECMPDKKYDNKTLLMIGQSLNGDTYTRAGSLQQWSKNNWLGIASNIEVAEIVTFKN